MRRRALLASVVAGVAGCSARDGDRTTTDDTTTTRNETPARTPATTAEPTPARTTERTPQDSTPCGDRPEAATRTVTAETAPRRLVSHASDPAENLALSLWFERGATAEEPARVRGRLGNTGEGRTVSAAALPRTTGRLLTAVDAHSATPDDYEPPAHLVLAPDEDHPLAETVPAVTRGDDGFWTVSTVDDWLGDSVRLERGECLSLSYRLATGPDTEGLPLGGYAFDEDGETAVTVWDTDRPGPTADSRFGSRSVPSLPVVGELGVQWFHEVDIDTRAFVRPSTERLTLDGRVDFEMVNYTGRALQCGHWTLYKLVDGEWFHLGPFVHTADCRILDPGQTETWSLRASNGPANECDCDPDYHEGYLGGGEYAVVAGYGHPEHSSGALLRFVGDPVTVEPTPDAEVETDGSVVTVTTDRWGDEESPADDRLELVRADSAGELLIPERLMALSAAPAAPSALRNALAVVDASVERVVVRTDRNDVRWSLDEVASRRIRFEGAAYELRRPSES